VVKQCMKLLTWPDNVGVIVKVQGLHVDLLQLIKTGGILGTG